MKPNSKPIVFLLALVAIFALGLSACAGSTPEPVEPIIETVIVEREGERVVETVIVTQEVERIVEVTPTPGPAPAIASTIRIDSLSEGTGRNFEEIVVKPFAQEMGVEITVEHGTYGSQEEWLSSVRAAPGDYCIATYFSDFGLYNGISQGLLQPFRLENMPNYSNIDPRWAERIIVEGDTNSYVATVDIGMYTFVYAKDMIDERPNSYAPLFDPQYAGRIALRDYGLYRMFQTAAYLGLDPNNLSDEDVDQIFATMEEQAQLARAYWQSSSQLDQLLANREVWMADYWFDTVTRVGSEGTNKLGDLNLGWWFPEEGGPMWAGGPVIAAGCEGEQRLTAEMLFDYMLRPDVFVQYIRAQGYIPTMAADRYDQAAFFANAPHQAAYQEAIFETGILLDVASILEQQEAWNERYEEMKLGQ
jgi:spermidine/putrescine-binding protein